MAIIKIWGENFSTARNTLEEDAKNFTQIEPKEGLKLRLSLLSNMLEKLSDRRESFYQ